MRVAPPMNSLLSRTTSLGLAAIIFSSVACSDSSSRAKSEASNQSTPIEQTKPNADKPSLTGLIKNVSLYPVPGRRDDLAISLVVSLHNAGLANRADGWNLEVNSPTPGVPTGLEPVHVNGVVDLPGANRSVDLAKEDLTVKAGEAIAANSQIEGVLTFVFPNTKERELSHNSSSLILHFKDGQGHAYQTPKTYIGKKVGE